MKIQVFKFGGASIENADRIKQMAAIVQNNLQHKLVLVVSAMGKTTNALEQVAQAYCKGDLQAAKQLFEFQEINHNALAQDLMPAAEAQQCIDALKNIYAEADWILHDKPVRSADYYYDQLVCLGEMMSTTVVAHYLKHLGMDIVWQDVRDIIRTDNNWREGQVDWGVTQQQISQNFVPLLEQHQVVITQGFVGSTDENESTTLGREGSDYTGAIFANCLDALNLSIWKDVKGLLSGDPKIFKQVREIPEISYLEVIEMAYYGAQVIHPKTIKPLQNKHIPLHVRCFLDEQLKGTSIINDVDNQNYPPILVLKRNQVLLQVFSKDFSFITDDKLSEIYEIFHGLQAHINIIQNTAISFLACIDYKEESLEKIKAALTNLYRVEELRDVQLLSIRHYNDSIINELTNGAKIFLEQRTEKTVQFLLKEGSIHL
jgi:aspartate kinase